MNTQTQLDDKVNRPNDNITIELPHNDKIKQAYIPIFENGKSKGHNGM